MSGLYDEDGIDGPFERGMSKLPTARPRTEREIRRDLATAEKAVTRTSTRRRDLPPGSSRARVTTANAKWSIACEHRDRLLAELAAVAQIAARLPPGATRYAPCAACARGITAPCASCGRPADRPAAARPAAEPRIDTRTERERDEDARDEMWQRRIAEARGK